jgi:hypothetical protein
MPGVLQGEKREKNKKVKKEKTLQETFDPLHTDT